MSLTKHTGQQRVVPTPKLEGMIRKLNIPYIITWESKMSHRPKIRLDRGVEHTNGHTRLAFHLHTPNQLETLMCNCAHRELEETGSVECEDCTQRAAAYGLTSNSKLARWCWLCASAHPDHVRTTDRVRIEDAQGDQVWRDDVQLCADCGKVRTMWPLGGHNNMDGGICARCDERSIAVQCILCSRRICNHTDCKSSSVVKTPGTADNGCMCRDCVEGYSVSADREGLGDTGECQFDESDGYVPDDGEEAEDALILDLDRLDLRGDREGACAMAADFMSRLADRMAAERLRARLFALGVRLCHTATSGGMWRGIAAKDARARYSVVNPRQRWGPGAIHRHLSMPNGGPRGIISDARLFPRGKFCAAALEPDNSEDKWVFRLAMAKLLHQTCLAAKSQIDDELPAAERVGQFLKASADQLGEGNVHEAKAGWGRALGALHVVCAGTCRQTGLWFSLGKVNAGLLLTGRFLEKCSQQRRVQSPVMRPMVTTRLAFPEVTPFYSEGSMVDPTAPPTYWSWRLDSDPRGSNMFEDEKVAVISGLAIVEGEQVAAIHLQSDQYPMNAAASATPDDTNGSWMAYQLCPALVTAAQDMTLGDEVFIAWWPDTAVLHDTPSDQFQTGRINSGIFLGFTSDLMHVRYAFCANDREPKSPEEEQALSDGLSAGIRPAPQSAGAGIFNPKGSLLGIHTKQAMCGTVGSEAGLAVTINEIAERENLGLLESTECLQECWPAPVYEAGLSIMAIMVELGTAMPE